MTKKSRNAPTAEQVESFFSYVADYQVLLNLQDWRIEHSGRKAMTGALADVGISYPDRAASISLGRDWGQPITDEMLRSTALHEVLHVFLKPLIESACSRDESAIDSAEHSLVVLLEKLLA